MVLVTIHDHAMSLLLPTVFLVFAYNQRIPGSLAETCPLRCPPPTNCMRTNDTCSGDPCYDDYSCVYPAHEAHLYSHEDGGRCPGVREDSPGPCVEQCRRDGDCRRGQACCPNGCGHTCFSIATAQSPNHRTGSCPWYTRELSLCQIQCLTDNGCPGQRKCCRTPCGCVCAQPCFHWLTRSQSSTTAFWNLPRRCQRPSHRVTIIK